MFGCISSRSAATDCRGKTDEHVQRKSFDFNTSNLRHDHAATGRADIPAAARCTAGSRPHQRCLSRAG